MNRFSPSYVAERESLIEKLTELDVYVDKPNEFRLSDLQSLYEKHMEAGKPVQGYLNYRQIAEVAGVKYPTFMDRIRKGQSLEEAILGNKREKMTGYLSIAQLAELAGMSYSLLYNRLYAGWTLEKAMKTPVDVKMRNTGNIRKKSDVHNLSRKERQAKRIALLNQLNKLEHDNGDPNKIMKLERELSNV